MVKFEPVQDVLKSLITARDFQMAHTREGASTPLDTDAGERFLSATMDEVRLHHAERYAKGLLARYDLDDAMHFHEAVLRRELSGRMAFPGQRDHAAHTVSNYLLGWLFFQHVEGYRKAFRAAVQKRHGEVDDKRLTSLFGYVWMFASLLHDVGYLLEGSLEMRDTSVQHQYVSEGVGVLSEYFDHRFWSEVNAPSVTLKRDLTEGAGALRIPSFDTRSLSSVASDLMHVPLSTLFVESVLKDVERETVTVADSDAFSIWQKHFRAFDQGPMADRVRGLKTWFDAVLWDGLPGLGVRVLDHGVCSGLILLQFVTFYFSVVAHARVSKSEVVKHWLHEVATKVSFGRWWREAVWGTGAAATHNMMQTAIDAQHDEIIDPRNVRYPKVEPLSLEEDPIAYLGLLVDVVQDWDRYAARRGAYVLHRGRIPRGLPLQGVDVRVRATSNSIEIAIDHKDPRDRMVKYLSRYLVTPEQLVKIT